MVMITPMMTMIQYGSTSYENIKKLFQKNGKNFQEKINKNVGDFPLLFGRLPPPSYHHLVPAHPQQAGDSGHDDDDDNDDDDDDDDNDDDNDDDDNSPHQRCRACQIPSNLSLLAS